MIKDEVHREQDFLAYLKNGNVSKTTLSLYPLALRERIPKQLQKQDENLYDNLFKCLDISYLKKVHTKLLTGGDLYDFSQSMSNGVPSASVGKYIKFLENIENLNNVKEDFNRYQKNYKSIQKNIGNLTFPHKNLLLKGVPGTGKSRAIENIINNKLKLENHKENILRINIHSASSNADLMQGIGISSNNGQIEYKEKQGLILNLIQKATFNPNQPFVLVLEEIQENSLNELIGDLIYLIEESKRAKDIVADNKEYEYQELIEKILADNPKTDYIEIPYLVNNSTEYRKMIMPNNLYVFCTSNYRDDRKVIEDNLLRRFDVVEIYPQYQDKLGKEIFKSKDVSDFLEKLNKTILKQFKNEIHPDRYLVGHANWLDITEDETNENKKLFYTALLKVIIEFKEIREIDFNSYVKPILVELFKKDNGLSHRVENYLEIFYENNKLKLDSYKSLVEKLQDEIYSDFL